MYPIPKNFAVDGTVVGNITWKRALETAIVVAGLGIPILKWAHISIKAKIYLSVIFILPSAIFSIRGVYGMSLFTFVYTFFKEIRRVRALRSLFFSACEHIVKSVYAEFLQLRTLVYGLKKHESLPV